MIHIKRSNSENTDFISLVKELDAHLTIVDGDAHDFYDQFNNIDVLKNVVLAYDDDIILGCGAFKEYTSNSVEIKRMFTNPDSRGKGIASKILTELEVWAKELNYQSCILETGIKMPDAIGLYTKMGYQVIPNYGQYAGKELSCCFKKVL